MRLIFVRHGEPNYEKDCLTEVGLMEAERAAERLMSEGIDEIYSSPQGRAVQTAKATALKIGKPVNTLEFMREIHWGSVNGLPIIANGHPWAISDDMIREGYDLSRADWRESKWYNNNLAVRSVDLVKSEIDVFLCSLGYKREGLYYRKTDDAYTGKTVALFSHGGSSTAALSHVLNIPFPYLCALLHMPFTGINTMRFDDELGGLCLPHLELSGDAGHNRER